MTHNQFIDCSSHPIFFLKLIIQFTSFYKFLHAIPFFLSFCLWFLLHPHLNSYPLSFQNERIFSCYWLSCHAYLDVASTLLRLEGVAWSGFGSFFQETADHTGGEWGSKRSDDVDWVDHLVATFLLSADPLLAFYYLLHILECQPIESIVVFFMADIH